MTKKPTLESLQKAVDQLNKRPNIAKVGVLPPTIISFYVPVVEEDGTVCSYVVPMNATMKVLAMSANKFDESQKDLKAVIEHKGVVTTTQELPLKFFRRVEKVEYKVSTGDVITVRVNRPDLIGQIAISLVMELEYNKAHKFQLIED